MLQNRSFETDLIEALMGDEADPNPLTGTKLAFFLATVAMLKEHRNEQGVKDGMSIYWRAVSRLGLINRDHKGLFIFGNVDDQKRYADAALVALSSVSEDDEVGQSDFAAKATIGEPDSSSTLSAQAEVGAEGLAAFAEKAQLKMPSGPSHDYIAAEIAAKRQMYKKPFEYRMGSGRIIGEFRYSELQHAEVLSAQDVKIFRAVREHAVADGDPLVADYFPEKTLTEILTEVKRHANN